MSREILSVFYRERAARGLKKSPESPVSVDSWVGALLHENFQQRFELEARALKRNWASLGRLSGMKLCRDI